MTLLSLPFVAFVCAACLLCAVLPGRLRYLAVLGCSVAFYVLATHGPPLQMPQRLVALGLGPVLPAVVPVLGLLVFTTLASYVLALGMEKARQPVLRVALLCLALLCCVGLWAACRYGGLLGIFRMHVGGITTEGGYMRELPAMALPLGFSFYTIQAAGYAADVFARRVAAEKNPLRFAAFLWFFPCISLGPMARAGRLLPQLRCGRPFSYNAAAGGLFRMLWGFVKVMVLAGALRPFTQKVLGTPGLATGPLLVLAVVLFCLQTTLDFAGCCDIAVGAARMLSYAPGENFGRPLAARYFCEVWRGWFASLSRLLRDNLTTPVMHSVLVRRAPGAVRAAAAFGCTVVVQLLFAAWHGLSADFLCWGLATGLLAGASLLTRAPRRALARRLPRGVRRVRRWVQPVVVVALFCACFVFFAAGYTGAPLAEWSGRLATGWEMLASGQLAPALENAGLPAWRLALAVAGAAAVAVVEAVALRGGGSVAGWVRRRPFYLRWPLYYLLIAALLLLGQFSGGGLYLTI